MKCLLLLVCLVAAIGQISGEGCHISSTCQHELCKVQGESVHCVRGVCTCADSSMCGGHQEGCRTNPLHCVNFARLQSCPCTNTWHCIDNHCRCGYPSGNSTQPVGR